MIYLAGMADALWMRIREVEWAEYETAHGDGSCMPTILRNLASRKEQRAMKAAHQAWSALCGGGKVHSAFVPCAMFLSEIFGISEPAVQEGILDIFILADASKAEVESDLVQEFTNAISDVRSDMRYYKNIKDPIIKEKLKDWLVTNTEE